MRQESVFNWRDVPVDISSVIFSYLSLKELSIVMQVSRLLFQLVHDPMVIQVLNLSNYSELLRPLEIRKYLVRSPCLKFLNLSNCDLTGALEGISLPNLRVLVLKECPSVMPEDILYLIQDSYLLKTVNLKKSLSAVNDDVLEQLSRCRQLNGLRIEQGFDISWVGVHSILEKCTDLQHLELINCPLLDVQAIKPMNALPWTFDESKDFLKMPFLSLSYLDISKCRGIDDEFLWGISLRCPNLTVLNVSHCSLVTDQGMLLLHRLLNLKSLLLSGCYLLTDKGIENYFQGSNLLLEDLDISMCTFITDQGLAMIFRFLSNVKTVNLAECSGISQNCIDTQCLLYHGRWYGSCISLL